MSFIEKKDSKEFFRGNFLTPSFCEKGRLSVKSYVVYLLRNMPCEGNLEGRYIGRTESPLAESSVKELLELKRTFQYPKAEAFYASPSVRCVDTLKLLYPQAEPEVILEMAECDFGDWENKTAEELKNEPGFSQWLESGGQTAPPHGESSPVFVQRVCMGFEMLVQNLMAAGKTTAVFVTHAGVLTTLLAAYGLPRAKPLDWMCSPGCGYAVRITPSLWMRSMVMEVISQLPQGEENQRPDHLVIDLAREAAEKAYGD